MKCEELLKAMNAYVDGELEPGFCEEFEQHLAGCNPCQVVVDNIRKTITLYKAGQPYEIPIEFRSRLHQTLKERWKARHGETNVA
ncbi:MAG: anti-sigma factor family protein [Tepidisphaerales bacterium]